MYWFVIIDLILLVNFDIKFYVSVFGWSYDIFYIFFYFCKVKFLLLLLICKVLIFFIFNICMCWLFGSGCVVVDFVVVVRFVLMFNWLFIFRGSFLDFIWLEFKVRWVLIVDLFILRRISFFLIFVFILLLMILFW